MAHPMAGQAKASQKARLKRLGASAGKSWGSSQMYKKTSYPKKNAGTQRELTISGGKGKRRADRMAGGGAVGKGKHKPHHTTNIVIAAPGGSGGGGGRPIAAGRPMMRPAIGPRPPLPVAAAPPVPPVGAAPMGGGMVPPAIPPRPIMPPVRPPIAAAPPPGAALPPRPPLGGMKSGGAVRKKNGGSTGRAYPGFPHSPTSGDADAVSAHANGGRVGRYRFGGLKKKLNPIGTLGGNNPNPTMGSAGADASLQVPAAGGLGGGTTVDMTTPTPTPPPPQPSGQGDKRGGSVKKRAAGGADDDDDDDGMSARVPPAIPQKRGGRVAKRQLGGINPNMAAQMQQQNTGILGLGANPALRPAPQQQGAPNISGRAARPATPLMVPPPANAAAALRARPAPGTMTGFKRGGHADEAADRKLFKRMMKEEKHGKKGR